MSEAGHDLHAEFPGDEAILHQMKTQGGHFHHVSAQYHEVAREIARIETGVEAASDERLEVLKKKRLLLLDEVAGMIAARKQAV
jgi:uncharacterized protein YdcH (DUF465 family)